MSCNTGLKWRIVKFVCYFCLNMLVNIYETFNCHAQGCIIIKNWYWVYVLCPQIGADLSYNLSFDQTLNSSRSGITFYWTFIKCLPTFREKALLLAQKNLILSVKTNSFFFTLLCGASKGFTRAFKAFIKPFEGSQRSEKIKISVTFFNLMQLSDMHGAGMVKQL